MKIYEHLQYIKGVESEINNLGSVTCIFYAEDTNNIYIVRKGQIEEFKGGPKGDKGDKGEDGFGTEAQYNSIISRLNDLESK